MKVWLFILLVGGAIAFGFWMEYYGNKCPACQRRKQAIADFFGVDKVSDIPDEAKAKMQEIIDSVAPIETE